MDSIIFDLDGTMWDSSEVVTVAWNDVLRRYADVPHVITKENLQGIMGLLPAEVGKILLPGMEEAVQQRLLDECCEAECQHLVKQGGVLYEELEEVLTALSAKYKLFIVSNCQKGYIEAFYEYHQLGRFS